MDLGGTLLIVMDVVFVVALAGAIAFGALKWHSVKDDRRRAEIRDRATRNNYREGG
jgi:hypothetical protein